ncbi:MAG: PilN domain-containing protein [Gemmatimonadaceae bacterium]
MSALSENASGSTLGIALSLTEVTAYDTRLKSAGGPAWRIPLESPSAENGSWPSLTAALRTLAQLSRESSGKLAVAVLSPAAEVRRVDVPPLGDDETEGVLSRNAARYFVGARGAQLVSVLSTGANRAAAEGIVAAAVPAWFARFVSTSAREAGWKVEQLIPAEAAWTAAVASAWPSSTKEVAYALVHHHDRTDLLHINRGLLNNVRRLRSATADAPVLLEVVPPGSTVLALGNAYVRKDWMAAMSARSVNVSLPSSLPGEIAGDSALVAAAFASEASVLAFRTDEMRQADIRNRTRLMYTLFAAATVLVGASALFMLWDVQRELNAVQSARLALKPQLATTVVGRASVETISGQLQMLAESERNSAHWSQVIADLTEHLPDNAYLTGLRGRSDTVTFDGLAEHASTVFPAVEKAKSFMGLKAAASVRQEAVPDGDKLERFTLAAKLRTGGTVTATDKGKTSTRPSVTEAAETDAPAKSTTSKGAP